MEIATQIYQKTKSLNSLETFPSQIPVDRRLHTYKKKKQRAQDFLRSTKMLQFTLNFQKQTFYFRCCKCNENISKYSKILKYAISLAVLVFQTLSQEHECKRERNCVAIHSLIFSRHLMCMCVRYNFSVHSGIDHVTRSGDYNAIQLRSTTNGT